MLQQYSHDFDGAMRSLAKASELDAQAPEPVAWRAAIDMVQARYADALGECTRMVPLAHPLYAQSCSAYVEATTGHLAESYGGLQKELAQAGDVPPELKL